MRGFDGTTIKVAGIENFGDFAGAEIGAEARFKRANDTNELNGIKIQYVSTVNDQQDPATALSGVRQAVTQQGVFALVPDLSAVNPGSYLASQQVPYLGEAFDATYCATSTSQTVWGFGFNGCLVTPNPPYLPDSFAQLYKYASAKTGKAHPTFAIYSDNDQSGITATRFGAIEAKDAGFNVVYAQGDLPITVSDYTPYVQQWLSAAGGGQPDVIACYAEAQCVPSWTSLKQAGFKGLFFNQLGPVDALAKAMAGTLTNSFYNTQPSAGLTQMKQDLQAFKPGTQPVGYSNVPAYLAADMFIQALKKVGKHITPEAVRQALDSQTWSIPGFAGPTTYPQSKIAPTPACEELLMAAQDGSGYVPAEPFGCTSTKVPVPKS